MPITNEDIRARLDRAGIVVPSDAHERLARLLEAFLATNAQINLSAIRDEDGVLEKHFVDSLMLLKFARLSGRGLDLGSGGGFPGLPLAIALPEVRITALDSVGKKMRCVRDFADSLGLPNVETVHARAEEAGRLPPHARSYDFVASRATAYLPKLLEWSAPFLRTHGRLYAYKLYSDDEMVAGKDAAKRFGFSFANAFPYLLDGQERMILEYVRVK